MPPVNKAAAVRAGPPPAPPAPSAPSASPATRTAAQRRRDLLAQVRAAVEDGDLDELLTAVHTALDAGLPTGDVTLLQHLEPAAADLLVPGVSLRPAMRTALKKWMEEDDAKVEAAATAGINAFIPSPALLARTTGAKVLVVGGDERSNAAARMCAAFGFASLDWERGWTPARVSATRAAVAAGRYDLIVLLIRFLGHRTSGPVVEAAKEAGAPVAWVQAGYGLTQVGTALSEALLAPPLR